MSHWFADADLATVDLVDDRVEHAVRVLQAGQVLGRADPALEPAVVVALTPTQRVVRIDRRRRMGAMPAGLGVQAGFADIGTTHQPAYRSDGAGLKLSPRRWPG